MKHFVRILTLFVFVSVCNKSHASFVLGCEIQYSYQSKDSVVLTINMYRDCTGVGMIAPTVRTVGVGCNFSRSTTAQYVSCSDVTPTCKQSCSKCDRTKCNAYGYPNGANAGCSFPYGIEKLVYKATVNLSSTNCCKFRFEVSRCCRSGAVTTCCTGADFYSYAEMDRCKASQNTSPKYNNNPNAMMCVGNCVSVNLGGADTTDNDSISYHIAPALFSYGARCTYQSSYTYKSPLFYDGFPNITKFNPATCKGFTLDSTTGILNFKPMQQQIAVVVIDIKEWRKDTTNKMVQVGLTRRDIEFIIVANCTNKSPSMPSSSQSGCAGNLICFSGIKSSDPDKKDTVRLTYSGNIPGAIFKAKFKGSAKQEFTFCWQTDSSHVSSTPYYFTVTATDDACPLSASISKTYSILINRVLRIATHKVTNIGCGKLKLQSTSSNATSKDTFVYTWTVGGKKYIAKDTVVYYIYDSIVVVKLEVNNKSCSMVYYDTLLKLPKNLKLDLGPDIYVCSGSMVSLKATPSNGILPYKYLWQTGNANDTLDNYTVATNTTTKIICEVTDSAGCISYDTVKLIAHALPILNLGSDISLCKNDSAILNAGKKGKIKSYSWIDLFSGNLIDSVQNIIVNKSAYIACTITDSFGCQNTDTIKITIGPKLSVNTNHSYIQCPNDTVTFLASGPDSMIWTDLNTGNIIYTGPSFKKSFAPNSNTEILLHSFKTDSGVMCDKYDTITVTVFPTPFVTFTRYNDTLYVNSSIPVIQYKWYRDYSFLDSTQLHYWYITQTGNYQVWIVHSNGCVDTSQSILITALYASISTIYNSGNIKVYPNPSTGIYNIESSEKIFDVTIYDLMGRRIINNSSNKNTIDLSTQPEGIYLLQINGNVWVRLSKL